jgi:hypothetical protein
MNPLVHYLTYGRREGRRIFPLPKPKESDQEATRGA